MSLRVGQLVAIAALVLALMLAMLLATQAGSALALTTSAELVSQVEPDVPDGEGSDGSFEDERGPGSSPAQKVQEVSYRTVGALGALALVVRVVHRRRKRVHDWGDLDDQEYPDESASTLGNPSP